MYYNMRTVRPILVVEDDLIDILTIKRALKEINVPNELVTVRNGEEALEYLESEDKVTPAIVLLDLNMPRMNGLEFLQEAREKKLLDTAPVIVLTTSKEESDRTESFKLHAAGYMVKPVDYNHFLDLLKIIDKYWTFSELPD